MVQCPSDVVGQEAEPPQVLVFGRLIDAGIEAMDILQELDLQGRLMIYNVIPEKYSSPHEVREAVQEVIGNCQALICRPSRGGKITAYLMGEFKEPFHIATISKGIDHIQIPKTSPVNIIRATKDGNGAAVAELALLLACLLLRPVHRAALSTANGDFDNSPFDGSRRLEGLTWTCVGSGAQVSYLLERLLGWRLKHLIIFHPDMNEARLQACLAGMASIVKTSWGRSSHGNVGSSPKGGDGPLQLSVNLRDDTELIIEGTRSLSEALARSEIVSIHLPLTREIDTAGRAPTLSMFNEELLRQMKKGSLLINVSRGDIVVEEAVLDAVRSGTLFGYGSDVINQEAEDTADPENSALWRTVISQGSDFSQDGEILNLILTPHIGGNTIDAINAVASEVINRLLEVLGVPLIVDEPV